jgi:hypothetical protein
MENEKPQSREVIIDGVRVEGTVTLSPKFVKWYSNELKSRREAGIRHRMAVQAREDEMLAAIVEATDRHLVSPKLKQPDSARMFPVAQRRRTTDLAERLLHCLWAKKDRDGVIGDLVEKYESEIKRRGRASC